MRAISFKHSPVALAALLALGAGSPGVTQAQTTPTTLPVVRPGGALINATVGAPVNNALTVTQTTSASNRALVEWSSFSIGSAARVNIAQPNAQSVLVNRVVGGPNGLSASEIYGTLSANGRVFLVNPAGVIFGATAQVNVGSLVATSLDLAPSMTDNGYARLMAGDDVALAQNGTTAVVQIDAPADPARPQIEVSEGGAIVLVSPGPIYQDGNINAAGGHINFATGSAATVRAVTDSGFIEVATVQAGAPASSDIYLGYGSRTTASGGSIVIGGQPKDDSRERGDSITITGLVSTDSATGAAGGIHIDAGGFGSVRASENGVITASSSAGRGGEITVLGNAIALQRGELSDPSILADGRTGGGSIRLGNEATRSLLVDTGSLLSADATGAGDGGRIGLFAMYDNPNATAPVARVDFGVTEAYGTLRARGGVDGGNGGRIETSGMAVATALADPASGLTKHGTFDARARAAGGLAGAWTLDPYDVTISNGAPVAVNGAFNPTGPGANVQASDLSAALDAGTSIDISTEAGGAGTAAGNIFIAADTIITRTTGGAATSLTLRANNNIVIDGATVDATRAGPVDINLYSDIDGNGGGMVLVNASSLSTGGGTITIAGGATPATGYARGDASNAAVSIIGSTVDTRSSLTPALRGDLVIRGQAGAVADAQPAVNLSSDFNLGNLRIDGRASHGTAVSLGGSTIATAGGTLDVRGIATRSDATAAQLVGIDTGALAVQLGTGSLTFAGRGDDAGLVTTGDAIGLRATDLRISADAASTGRITLAGQSAGATLGSGLLVTPSTGSLVISSDASLPGNAATGASVVLGGLSDAARAGMSLGTSATAPNIASSSGVNLRPLGVDANGTLTEQPSETIWIGTPTAAGASTRFLVDPAWLRVPGGNNSGISGGTGVVIGSSGHTGLITLEAGALAAHAGASLTLQNQGAGSSGIALGGGNTVGNLALMSAGDITQTGALTVNQGLALEGGAASDFVLSNAGNQIGRVAFDPPATLNLQTAGTLTVDAVTAQGFNSSSGSFTPLAITGSLGGDSVLLQSAAAVLVNQPIQMTGSGASQLDIVSPTSVTFAPGAALTSTSSTGRWQVWSPTVVNAPIAGPATNLYGCVFGDTTLCSVSGVSLPATGNQLLHPTQPTLNVTANPATGYLDLALPALTYTATGLVNGDTVDTALAGTLAATPSGTSTYSIGQGDLRSPLGYNVTFTPSTLTLRPGITRHMLQSAFLSEAASDVYGNNLDQPFVCTAASVIRGGLADGEQADPLTSEWGKVRNQPQLSGCLNVTDGGSCSAF